VREAAGPACAVIATLDLHCNISARMLAATDCMVAMRTNPHVDTAQRGEEAAVCLLQMLCGARPRQLALRLPLVPPAIRQLSAVGEPYGEVLRRGQALLDAPGALGHIMNVSAVSGFPWCDTEKNGFTVIVTARDGRDPASVTAARAAAVELGRLAWQQRDAFAPALTPLPDAVAHAHAGQEGAPVILCDCADNPGAGARGNTTYILQALLAARTPGVFFGVFFDPALVRAARAAGEGRVFDATLNAEEPSEFSMALRCPGARVLRLSDGRFVGTRGLVARSVVALGDSCLLELGGPGVALQLVAITDRTQILSTDYFEHFGLDMANACAIVVKSRGHFRAGFQHLVPPERVYEVDVPGLSCQNLSNFEWRSMPRPSWPLDAAAHDSVPEVAWEAALASTEALVIMAEAEVAA
jgi:microcystin degradation protein MlrC